MNHQANARAVVLGLVAMTLIILFVPTPSPKAPPPSPLEAPVPLQEWTTADAGAMMARVVPGRLPTPGPNQLRAGQCDPERSEKEVNGGCWVKTEKPPPCPRGKQWEHEGACWLPVAQAKPVPTSGGGEAKGVANP